jgi:hypothetical protein
VIPKSGNRFPEKDHAPAKAETMHLDQGSVTQSAGRDPTRTRPWLRRLVPVAVVVLVMAVVFAMGWHRFLSLETLVRHRAAIEGFVAARYGLAIAAFIAIYVAAVALSIPGRRSSPSWAGSCSAGSSERSPPSSAPPPAPPSCS